MRYPVVFGNPTELATLMICPVSPFTAEVKVVDAPPIVNPWLVS